MQKFSVTKVVQAIERPIARAIRGLLVVLFSLMLGLSSLQIALLFFFGTSILWEDHSRSSERVSLFNYVIEGLEFCLAETLTCVARDPLGTCIVDDFARSLLADE